MKRAVIFGAGSVGRGFLGQLLCEAGWFVTFVDVDPELVATLAHDGSYPHLTVSDTGSRRTTVGPVTAIAADRTDAVIDALLPADLAATSVGARVLPAVADSLARGVGRRIELGLPPLDVLLAENVHGCAALMRGLLADRLPWVRADVLAAHVGLLETSVGRMIPGPQRGRQPEGRTLVRSEPYRVLPYDAAAAVGPPLEVAGLLADPSVPFSFYGDRKLYVHNLGHCLTACLGLLHGEEFVWQTVQRPEARYLVRCAMLESAMALATHYAVALPPLVEHVIASATGHWPTATSAWPATSSGSSSPATACSVPTG
jgi:mannitol-1-phosphate 5-dehydrogenase